MAILQMLCQISGPGKTFATELTRYIFKMYRFNMIHDIGSLLVREITYATLPESTFRSLYRIHFGPHIIFSQHEACR